MSPTTLRSAKLRRAILELDRIWGSAVLGLALCEVNDTTVEMIAHMTESTPATTRRRLDKLVAIGRVSKDRLGNVVFYRPEPRLCDRTKELTDI